MRKRRIERAILLGLVLSTSIYGTSFAEDINETNKEYRETELNADNIYLMYDENFEGTSPIWVGGTVNATNEFKITNTNTDQTKGKGNAGTGSAGRL